MKSRAKEANSNPTIVDKVNFKDIVQVNGNDPSCQSSIGEQIGMDSKKNQVTEPLNENSTKALELAQNNFLTVRENILFFVRTRDRYIILSFIAMGLIFSFALTNENTSIVLLSVPIVLLVSSLLYVQADITVGIMAKWIKEEYVPFVDNLTGHEIPNWDRSNFAETFFSKKAFSRRNLGLSILFLSSGILAYIIRFVVDDNFSGVVTFMFSSDVNFSSVRHPILYLLQHALHIVCTVTSTLALGFTSSRRKSLHSK